MHRWQRRNWWYEFLFLLTNRSGNDSSLALKMSDFAKFLMGQRKKEKSVKIGGRGKILLWPEMHTGICCMGENKSRKYAFFKGFIHLRSRGTLYWNVPFCTKYIGMFSRNCEQTLSFFTLLVLETAVLKVWFATFKHFSFWKLFSIICPLESFESVHDRLSKTRDESILFAELRGAWKCNEIRPRLFDIPI